MKIENDVANRVSVTQSDVEALQLAIAAYPNVTWLRTSAADCPVLGHPVGLLYIDGNHQYPAPLHDFSCFGSLLNPGAYVAFHDFKVFGGVTQSVLELESAIEITAGRSVGSMHVARRSPWEGDISNIGTMHDSDRMPEPKSNVFLKPRHSQVTGFHLVCLCYRFAHRARAFAASIARQTGNPYSMHLTCFYTERIDAHHILEGLTAGDNTPSLSLRRIEASRIMQRAMHFSSLLPDDRYSHTVFLDCDLWFPPSFWHRYGEAVSCELPGYWSAHIMDTDSDCGKQLANEWDVLTELSIAARSNGIRHDGFNGMVGHFQCVPSQIAKYPEDSTHAVNGADEVFARQAIEKSVDKRRDRRIGSVCAYHLGHPSYWTGSPEQL
jgi:hypothetical protein